MCVRISQDDLLRNSFKKELLELTNELNLTPKDVDVLIDLKLIHSSSMSIREACSRLPSLLSWRTFSVASGAFPKDLSNLEKNQTHELPRDDWSNWITQVASKPLLLRRPTFSDYTIQHAIYFDPPQHPNPSASIRYTSKNSWIIMRGEGLLNEGGTGNDQYWAEANLLRNRKEYCSPHFSKGDMYIYQTSLQREHPGTPQTWLRATINHHLVFVLRQIASSFGSATDGVPGPGSGRNPPPQPVFHRRSHGVSGARSQPYQVPLTK